MPAKKLCSSAARIRVANAAGSEKVGRAATHNEVMAERVSQGSYYRRGNGSVGRSLRQPRRPLAALRCFERLSPRGHLPISVPQTRGERGALGLGEDLGSVPGEASFHALYYRPRYFLAASRRRFDGVRVVRIFGTDQP